MCELLVALADPQTPWIGQIGRVLLDDLADLFVDRDGLEREALSRVVLADPIVGRDRLGISLQARLQISDLEERPSVVRILLDDLLVLRDRPVVPLFLDVLLGALENFLSVDRHDERRKAAKRVGLMRRRSRFRSRR
jgi:hypothetical protein